VDHDPADRSTLYSCDLLLKEVVQTTLNKRTGHMFKSIGWTWNPCWGCSHECKYCYAKKIAEKFECGNFEECHFRPHFLKDKFPNDGTIIMVASMGDIFCDGMKDHWIEQIIEKCFEATNNRFLFPTKNPSRAIDWLPKMDGLQQRPIIGTTLETNRDTPWSKAPTPTERFTDLWYSTDEHAYSIHDTFLSLEPLSDFDMLTLVYMVKKIRPIAVEIGLENYTHFTETVSDFKICTLLRWLKHYRIPYVLKKNLEHMEAACFG